jgi:hypothetical protein
MFSKLILKVAVESLTLLLFIRNVLSLTSVRKLAILSDIFFYSFS